MLEKMFSGAKTLYQHEPTSISKLISHSFVGSDRINMQINYELLGTWKRTQSQYNGNYIQKHLHQNLIKEFQLENIIAEILFDTAVKMMYFNRHRQPKALVNITYDLFMQSCIQSH